MFQRRKTFTVIALLLWFVAGNHCAVEALLENLGLTPSTAHAAPRSNGDCPSHSEGDSAKHQEGQLCGTTVLVETKSPVSETKIVFVSFISSLVTVLSTSAETNNFSLHSPPTENFSPHRRLRLLSAITANAPPIHA